MKINFRLPIFDCRLKIVFLIFILFLFGGGALAQETEKAPYSLKEAMYDLSGLSKEEKEKAREWDWEVTQKKLEIDRLNKERQDIENKSSTNEEDIQKLVETIDRLIEARKEFEELSGFSLERYEKLQGELIDSPEHLPGTDANLQGDAGDLTIFLQRIINGLAGVAASVAVLFLIVNAFNMLTAAGDSDTLSKAKKGIIWSLVGLILVIGSFILVKTIISLTYEAEKEDGPWSEVEVGEPF